MELHKFTLENKTKDGSPLSGPNARLLIDGKEVKGVTGVYIELGAKSVCRVTLEMVADFTMHDEIGTLNTIIKPFIPKEIKANVPTK